MVVDWYTITTQALQNLWLGFLNFIPALIGAIIVFVIGWFIALGIGRLVSEILVRLRFNKLFEKSDWQEALAKADLKVDPAGFIGAIVKWVLVIVFLLAAVEILGFVQFADLLKRVLGYLDNVIIAALIFVVAVIVADILEKIVVAAVQRIRVGYAHLAGAIVKWAIWIFAILIILHQLGIAPPLIQILFTGLIATLVIGLGLAFGLGGKDVAREVLEDLRRRVKRE